MHNDKGKESRKGRMKENVGGTADIYKGKVRSRVSIIDINDEGSGLLILCQTVRLLAIVLMTEPGGAFIFPR